MRKGFLMISGGIKVSRSEIWRKSLTSTRFLNIVKLKVNFCTEQHMVMESGAESQLSKTVKLILFTLGAQLSQNSLKNQMKQQ